VSPSCCPPLLSCLPHIILPLCSVSFLPSLFPVVSLTYHPLFGIPTVLQQCTSLQICCFPNVVSFFSVSLHVLSPSRCVFYYAVSPPCRPSFLSCLSHICLSPDFLPSLFPVVSLVHILLLACFTVLQQRHLHFPSQFHCLPNVALFSLSLCLSPSRRVFSCNVSFLLSLLPIVSLVHILSLFT
jgi:hypothetical protein